MADKLRSSDPLDGISLIVGLKFSKSIVLHKDDILWIDTKLSFDRIPDTPIVPRDESPPR